VDGEPGGRGESRPPNEQFWYDYLTRGDALERRVRRIFKLIPAAPRCQLCAAPFTGFGAPIMRAIGKRPARKNPRVCSSCFDFIERHHGGAEIQSTFLFADIRGSTSIAERTSPREFGALLDRFYAVASQVVFDHDGSVDKFVGDELVAAFFPVMSGEGHVAHAVDASLALLVATGHTAPEGPWVPVGAGVHTGVAWVGAVGDAAHTELTALGDTVNTTARLAAAAGAGEVLVTIPAAEAAGIGPGLERRSLELKGKRSPTDVVVLRAGGGAAEH
jgi:adenylate cyclase